ncbi:hypothetical protein GCK72_024264 [Caenorhabditis remanei]|uniref:Piwi domain-containing protein n=1 Tax=Caenorhabditis remanei TaxID=31234 RepID=A0A6A5FYS2_CAERE|nr:hypothetical protein GCK72_024264 [Caenorhabditis remanei]KAF1747798.1 hypothetical protein GCK72_024264 [Caenorhabditis remanei]
MDALSKQLGECGVGAETKKKLGLIALAPKLESNKNGTTTTVDSNLRKLNISPNQPIYKYDVKIACFYTNAQGNEVEIEFSKSPKKDSQHDRDKMKCQKFYEMAVNKTPALQKAGGKFFYDRQASLYSTTKLAAKLEFSKEASKAPNFVRAVFELKAVAESYQATSNGIRSTVHPAPALADKTLVEAISIFLSGPAYSNKNVITIGNCVHYLLDTSGINVKMISYDQGFRYSALGASKGVKSLQGTNKDPSLYMVTEMKSTLFHPDDMSIVDLMQSYPGFTPNFNVHSPAGAHIAKAIIGLEVYCDYGKNQNNMEEALIVKIIAFDSSSRDVVFDCDGVDVSVQQYFKNKYNITLKYPDLPTAVAKGKKGGKIHLPVELLKSCPSQKVTNNQMIGNEQADMIKLSAAPPHQRKPTTDAVAKAVGIAADKVYGFIEVEASQKVQGIILPKPKIAFAGNKFVAFGQNAKCPTDFSKAGHFYEAKELKNWEMCYFQNDEIQGLSDQLVAEMSNNGMRVAKPTISYIVKNDLEAVFKKAKQAGRQLIFFVIRTRYNIHQAIKSFEQKYDILTQEIHFETGEKFFRQAQTRQNIVNKTNMKLGGLNYLIGSNYLNNPRVLIIGFETSQTGGDIVTVGYAANMMDHYQKFAGGYIYTARSRDIYGPIIKDTLVGIFNNFKKFKNRGAPEELIIYFNGVTEGQYGMINEEYTQQVKNACSTMNEAFRPKITIIATSKTHNERLYKSEQGRISNLEPGTVVDHTIVSPVYSEFYLASSVARQGTTKAAKFTLIYASAPGKSMERIETLTNDLCYDHQIVFHPVGLPVPLFIAGRYSQRGAMVLGHNGPSITNKEVDLVLTNQRLGYSDKNLFGSRYNA